MENEIEQLEQEITNILDLLKIQVMNNVGGSLSNKMDYWEEYCKEHKINYR